jgi:hypothetical protein
MYTTIDFILSERKIHLSLPHHMSYRIYPRKEGRIEIVSRNKGRKKWWTDSGRARGRENCRKNEINWCTEHESNHD